MELYDEHFSIEWNLMSSISCEPEKINWSYMLTNHFCSKTLKQQIYGALYYRQKRVLTDKLLQKFSFLLYS